MGFRSLKLLPWLLLVGFAFNSFIFSELMAYDRRLAVIGERPHALEPDAVDDGPDLEDVLGAVFVSHIGSGFSTQSVKSPLPSGYWISGVTNLMPRETGPPLVVN